ncbi:potassium/sodium hyperpolarization-activated cyclic nucleotide-gated channel 2 [Oreochromis niloticus]|uniref:potassium/sodium hyperpolarization-activated cyclic nucleotide-gated channel 2 n=1 Tax=Oreochromis niloticus TaxID=8128 RepID=UPI000393F7C9|nr:potassium/sodium hyperpolarization-activated cyclic nucleotide-gated channel 2 [Oreochromis niloticus]
MTVDRDQYMDPQLRERQDAAFAELEEELRLRPWHTPEYGQIFRGTRLALGGPRSCRKPPPVASPAPKLRPLQVGILCVSSDAHAPASVSPFCMPEAQPFSPPASPSRRKRRTRRHKLDNVKRLPVGSSGPAFLCTRFSSTSGESRGSAGPYSGSQAG